MIGNVVTFPLCGLLVDAYGWPTAFYVIGGIEFKFNPNSFQLTYFNVILGITLVWLAFWCLLVYDSPERHPYIGREEREYIREKLPQAGKVFTGQTS